MSGTSSLITWSEQRGGREHDEQHAHVSSIMTWSEQGVEGGGGRGDDVTSGMHILAHDLVGEDRRPGEGQEVTWLPSRKACRSEASQKLGGPLFAPRAARIAGQKLGGSWGSHTFAPRAARIAGQVAVT